MRVEAEEIRKRLLEIQPHLKNSLRLYDEFYQYPLFNDIKQAVIKYKRHRVIKYKEFVADCDKKSLWLNADIKEHCALNNFYYTWTFGMASGIFWNGEFRNHTGNIFLTKDKIFLIDSSDRDETWELDSKKDFLIEVRI